jgi:hypothetical protein
MAASSQDSAPSSDAHADESHSEPAEDSSAHGSSHDDHPADTKIDSPPGTYTMADFAKYTKNNKKSATLKLDSLGISLNINYIDGEPYPDDEPKEHTTENSDYLVGLIPEWNYDLHGSDWPDKYPNCAD